MRPNPHALRIRLDLLAMVMEAVENGQILNSRLAAEQLSANNPRSGMTVREIEDEIIRQVGMAKGAAVIGSSRQGRRSASRHRPPSAAA